MQVQKADSLFNFLLEKIGTASPTRVRKMIKLGYVRVNGKVVLRPDHQVKKGQIILIRREKNEAQKLHKKAKTAHIPLHHKDKYLIVVEKPEGKMLIPRKKHPENLWPLLVTQLEQESKRKETLYPVLLPYGQTGGLALLARTQATKEHFDARMSGVVGRVAVLVEGTTREESGKLKVQDPMIPTKQYTVLFKRLKGFPNMTLLEVQPKGRKRSIIFEALAQEELFVVGDKARSGDHRNRKIAFYQFHLSFIHPVHKSQLKFTTPIPRTFFNFPKNKKGF